jgi:hypothetical protein
MNPRITDKLIKPGATVRRPFWVLVGKDNLKCDILLLHKVVQRIQ